MATLRSLGLALALAASGVLPACTDNGPPDWPIAPPVDPSRLDSDGDGALDASDCDPHDAKRSIEVSAFLDQDGDTWGTGNVLRVCTSANIAPPGWASRTGDCDDKDRTRWRLVKGLYPDQDGDGATGPGPVEGCVGDTLVGYRTEPGREDCDDQDARYSHVQPIWPDTDRDGYGAGVPKHHCAFQSPPSGYSSMDGDCDPENPLRAVPRSYAYRDADRDGLTVHAPGTLCIGNQEPFPPGYANFASGEDCDDQDATKWFFRDVYVDTDGDGFGTGTPQQQCAGLQPTQGKAFFGEDCAADDATRWQWRSYAYRDADGDGATVPENGVSCSGAALPSGYDTLPHGLDCDDQNPAIRVSWKVYPDADKDGVGSGEQVTICAGGTIPSGHSTTSTDCAPSDVSAWRMVAYAHRDTDGDGFTVPQTGELCVGGALPSGYSTSANGADCDDANVQLHTSLTAWADSDGDGVGAGESTQLCTSGQVPPPWSGVGTDCAADDATLWRQLAYSHVDRDADGATAPEKGSACAGAALPAPYFTRASGNDCDETDPTRTRWMVLYPDHDGDGVGAEPRQVSCIGATIPPGWSIYGYDTNDNDPNLSEDAESDLELELLLNI